MISWTFEPTTFQSKDNQGSYIIKPTSSISRLIWTQLEANLLGRSGRFIHNFLLLGVKKHKHIAVFIMLQALFSKGH